MERLMPAPIPNHPAQILRETNQRLSLWLDSLVLDHRDPAVATPQQMMGLLSELLRAGEWLRTGLPAERDAELAAELDAYHKNVERLHKLLPSIQRRLLEERARLEAERTQLEASAEWARASRQTL
jgi:hypothetical protein